MHSLICVFVAKFYSYLNLFHQKINANIQAPTAIENIFIRFFKNIK